MAERNQNFGWGVIVGGVLGLAVGTYLASSGGRQRLELLRDRTVELVGNREELGQRALRAVDTVRNATQEAFQEGVSVARQRQRDLTGQIAEVTQSVSGSLGGNGRRRP
ncbi:MAG: hypothetical protein ACREN8_07250 [Candidatus Dormibacteraceae bacterium]